MGKDGAGGTDTADYTKATRQIEVIIKEAEVLKINPQPGEILLFKFKGDDFMSDDVQKLGDRLRALFKTNKIVVMTLPSGHDVELTTIQENVTTEPVAPVKDCSQPTSYCNNCNCGKKERIESGQE